MNPEHCRDNGVGYGLRTSLLVMIRKLEQVYAFGVDSEVKISGSSMLRTLASDSKIFKSGSVVDERMPDFLSVATFGAATTAGEELTDSLFWDENACSITSFALRFLLCLSDMRGDTFRGRHQSSPECQCSATSLSPCRSKASRASASASEGGFVRSTLALAFSVFGSVDGYGTCKGGNA